MFGWRYRLFIFAGVLASMALALTTVAPAYAVGEQYGLEWRSASGGSVATLYGSEGNFLSVFEEPNEVALSSLGTGSYPDDSSMLVFYYEGSLSTNAFAQCSSSTAYVQVDVNTSTKKTTQVKAACGQQSEGGTTPIFKSGDTASAFNSWDQSVSVSVTGSPSSGSGTPVDISGTPTFNFNTDKATDGSAITACGGFFKQFGSNCVQFSNSTNSNDSAAVFPVGDEDAALYAFNTGVPGGCTVNVRIAVSLLNRSLEDGSLSGYAGYRLFTSSGTNVTDLADAKQVGCKLERPSNKDSWETPPGLAITIGNADKLESFLGESVETKNGGNSSCRIDSIGWLVCPATWLITKLNDAMYGLMSRFLEIESSMFDTKENSTLYDIWSNIRNLSNGLFVIVFLILIYSQMIGGRGK